MTFTGHVIDGLIVLDGTPALPDGAAVRVEVVAPRMSAKDDADHDETGPTLAEQLKDFLRHQVELPPDAAENHDYYIRHGLPRGSANP
jgi:hypothetical protein